MDLSRLQPVYGRQGPFATVYLESRSPGDDASHQTQLRWEALRERLASEGATPETLDAIDAALAGEQGGEVQANGRVLVATDAGVALDAAWDAALGSGDAAHWTNAPELGAFVREEARSVRLLVVIAQQQGAVMRHEIAAAEHTLDKVHAHTVEGGRDHEVHKPRGGALSHNQLQRRAEHAVQRNARDITAHLSTAAGSFDPHIVVLAGEVQARAAIRDELPTDLAERCVDVGRGGTDDDAAERALADELRTLASDHSARSAAGYSEQFHQAQAHDLAVQGADAVEAAATTGAVETLLLNHDKPAVREGELLHASAATGASADLADTDFQDHVGAVLRFPLPATADTQETRP